MQYHHRSVISCHHHHHHTAFNPSTDIDEAVQRRFESKIFVGLPDASERFDMIVKYLAGVAASLTSAQIRSISHMTESWNGSDLQDLCREAAMVPLRTIVPTLLHAEADGDHYAHHMMPSLPPVCFGDFVQAHGRMVEHSNRTHLQDAEYPESI